MLSTERLILILTFLTLPSMLAAQGRPPIRETLDDRLASIEDRLSAIEHQLVATEDRNERREQTDRLSLESQAKLDRLEVRVIQLEGRSSDSAPGTGGDRALLARIRSLERQVARLRSAMIR